MAAVLEAVLVVVAAVPEACRLGDDLFPAACRPEDGLCLVASAPGAAAARVAVGTQEGDGVPEAVDRVAVGNPEEAGDGEGAVGSRDTRFCGPILDRGHSNARKPPWRMCNRPNRHNQTAIIRRAVQER